MRLTIYLQNMEEFLIDDCLVEANACKYSMYKNKYHIVSNEYYDDEIGLEVIILADMSHIFLPATTFTLIAASSNYE